MKKWIIPLLLFCCLSMVIMGTASASTNNNGSNNNSNSGINNSSTSNQTVNDDTDPQINVTNNTSALTTNDADPSGNVTLTELSSAAGTVKNYYESNNSNLPSNVTINEQTVTMPQLLQLLATSTVNINNNNLNSIPIQSVNPAPSPSGSYNNGSIVAGEYLTLASSIQNFVNNNGRAPNYATTSLGKLPFNTLVYIYGKILNFYGTQHVLPNSVTTNASPSAGPLTVSNIIPASNSTNVPITNNIVDVFFKTFVQPSYGFNDIYILDNANNTHVSIKATTNLSNMLILIAQGDWAPLTSYTIVIPANALTDENGNNLAGTFNSTFTTAQAGVSNNVTLTQLSTAASTVKSYYESNNGILPVNVTINGQSVTMPEFLRLITVGTINIHQNLLIPLQIFAVNPATNPSGSFAQGNLNMSEYLNVALNIQTFIINNGRAPNYASTSLGLIPFSKLVYMYSKIFNFYGINDRLPSYVSIT